MLQAGKIYEIEASDLTLEGKGVGRADGVAVFVPDLLPGRFASKGPPKTMRRARW